MIYRSDGLETCGVSGCNLLVREDGQCMLRCRERAAAKKAASELRKAAKRRAVEAIKSPGIQALSKMMTARLVAKSQVEARVHAKQTRRAKAGARTRREQTGWGSRS